MAGARRGGGCAPGGWGAGGPGGGRRRRGRRQAAALGGRWRAGDVETVYVSPLRRSWRTADIAFGGTAVPIVRDARLAECDYGEMARRPVEEMAAASSSVKGVKQCQI